MDELKKCGHCRRKKLRAEFYPSARLPSGLSSWCRKCDQAKSRSRTGEARRKYRKSEESNRLRRKKVCRDYVNSLKSRPCRDCGKTYPSYVMDLDHRDHSQKENSVALMVGSGRSFLSVKAEADKCDVVCSNCHRERTYGPLASRHPRHRSKE